MIALFYLLAGFLLAGLGGEAFVRGSVGLSKRLNIPTAVIGVTIAAFATSSPELSVAVNAAMAGTPQIALGDALGSSVVNISLILGLALCFGALPAKRAEVKRDWLLALAAPFLITLFAYDGMISRVDGLIMFVLFLGWLIWVVHDVRRYQKGMPLHESEENIVKAGLYCVIGVVLLVFAGLSIVRGAEMVGVIFGISPFVIGATLVALGTSMPELATTLIARLRGHHDMGLGTVLGSNIFNVFVIVSLAAVIHPIAVTLQSLLIVLSLCVLTTVMAWPTQAGNLPRRRGFALLLVYVAYVVLTLKAGAH